MGGKLDSDVQVLVAKDLFCFADNGISELGMEIVSGDQLVRGRLDNGYMNRLIGIDGP